MKEKKSSSGLIIVIIAITGVFLLLLAAIVAIIVVGWLFYDISDIRTKGNLGATNDNKMKEIQVSVDNFSQYLITEDGEEMELVYDSLYEGDNMSDDYLVKCGGMAVTGYYLKTESGLLIRSREKLLEEVGGIDSLEEAAAFMYATHCDFRDEFQGNIPKGKEVTDGYYLELIYYPVFGCGVHAHQKITYIIEENGEVFETGTELLEKGEEMCVD